MTPFSEACGEDEVASTINKVMVAGVTNSELFYKTIDRIEECVSPTKNQRLTLSELEAWASLVTTTSEEGIDADYTTLQDHQNRPVPNKRKTINPRPTGTVHQHD